MRVFLPVSTGTFCAYSQNKKKLEDFCVRWANELSWWHFQVPALPHPVNTNRAGDPPLSPSSWPESAADAAASSPSRNSSPLSPPVALQPCGNAWRRGQRCITPHGGQYPHSRENQKLIVSRTFHNFCESRLIPRVSHLLNRHYFHLTKTTA